MRPGHVLNGGHDVPGLPGLPDQDGAVGCGLPAEVNCRFTMRTTDGPLECTMVRCATGHQFNGRPNLLLRCPGYLT